MKRPTLVKVLDEVTATTTSDAVDIEGASRISLLFKRADHSSGNTVFTVLVSIDDIDYITFNKLVDNLANTNGQQLTRVASVTLSSATQKLYAMDLQHSHYRYMKIVATETTDGTHTAKAYIEKEV